MKNFILITAIIELIAGIALFITPELVPDLKGASIVALTMARMYGAAAIALGYYALLVWRNFGPGPATGFLKTFTAFHVGVAVASFFGYSQGLTTFIGVVVLHGLLAIITIYFLFNSQK